MAHIEERKGRGGATRFRARIFLHEDPVTGKQKVLSENFDNREDAEVWAAERERDRKRGSLVEPSKETLADYGRAWLDSIARDKVKPSTWRGYCEKFRNYIEKPPDDAPQVGRVRMDQIRPEHIQRLYTWLRSDHGKSPATIRQLHAILRQILTYAAEVEAIPKDIAPRIKAPRKIKREVLAMSRVELGRFLESARGDRYYPLYFLLQATGLRPGEALALRWEDVDFDNRILRVHRSLTRIAGKGKQPWEFTTPKTDSGRRAVRLPRSVLPVLEEHRIRQIEERLKAGPSWPDQGLIFTTQPGNPVDWTNLWRHWVRILRGAGLGTLGPQPEKPKGQPGPRKRPTFTPTYRPYDLRHTHATLSIRAGVPIKVVSERLGHASVTFTMEVYVAYLPDMQEAAADAWDEIAAAHGGLRTLGG
jgi:integrase